MLWPQIEGVYYLMYSHSGLRSLAKEMDVLQLRPVHTRREIKVAWALSLLNARVPNLSGGEWITRSKPNEEKSHITESYLCEAALRTYLTL